VTVAALIFSFMVLFYRQASWFNLIIFISKCKLKAFGKPDPYYKGTRANEDSCACNEHIITFSFGSLQEEMNRHVIQ